MLRRAGAGDLGRCSSLAEPPYSGLALIYDDVVGDAVFPLIRRSFEQAVRRYNIAFFSAADIGCGTGRFLKYLQRFGIRVIGVDRSPHMLRMAAMRRRPGREIKLVQQEMTRLRLPFSVDLVTCNFDTLNYILKTHELLEIFKRVHLNLTPMGYFTFDMLCPNREGSELQAAVQEIRLPNVRGKWTTYWNPIKDTTAVHMVHLFHQGPAGCTRIEETHRQRWYSPRVICSLLKKAGFRLRGAHEAETFRPATAQSHWIKWVTQKI